LPEPTYVERGATFSPCGLYRYGLVATWDASKPRLGWGMLNPSSADAEKLDPTLTRVKDFTMAWGFGGFEVWNLFGFRSPKPTVMRAAVDPVGPDNDAAILAATARCAMTIAGWGVHGNFRHREDTVRRMLANATPRRELHALKLTKGGFPQHPLYLAGSLTPFPWS